MSYPPQGYGSGGYGGEQSGGYGGQQPGYGGQPWSGAQPGGGQQDPFFPAYGEAPALDSYATPGGPGGPPPGGTSRGLVIGLTSSEAPLITRIGQVPNGPSGHFFSQPTIVPQLSTCHSGGTS